jgi:hypothetical protein
MKLANMYLTEAFQDETQSERMDWTPCMSMPVSSDRRAAPEGSNKRTTASWPFMP